MAVDIEPSFTRRNGRSCLPARGHFRHDPPHSRRRRDVVIVLLLQRLPCMQLGVVRVRQQLCSLLHLVQRRLVPVPRLRLLDERGVQLQFVERPVLRYVRQRSTEPAVASTVTTAQAATTAPAAAGATTAAAIASSPRRRSIAPRGVRGRPGDGVFRRAGRPCRQHRRLPPLRQFRLHRRDLCVEPVR